MSPNSNAFHLRSLSFQNRRRKMGAFVPGPEGKEQSNVNYKAENKFECFIN